MTEHGLINNDVNNMAMSTNTRLRTPYEFSGEEKGDPEVFLKKLIKYCESMGLSEEEKKIAFELSLKKEAAQWLASQGDKPFNHLCEIFLSRFVPPNKKVTGLIRLRGLTPQENETLLGFLDRAAEIAMKAGVDEQTTVAHILAALPSDILNNFKLVATGKEWDFNLLYQLSYSFNYDSTGQLLYPFKRHFESMQPVAAIKESISYSNKKRNEVECYFCHKKGHLKRNCFSFKRYLQSLSGGQNVGVANMGLNSVGAGNFQPTCGGCNCMQSKGLNKDNRSYQTIMSVFSVLPAPSIQIFLNGQTIRALVDTGSGVSIIKSKFLNSKPIQNTIRLTAANGSMIDTVK